MPLSLDPVCTCHLWILRRVPHIDAGGHFMRVNTKFPAVSNFQCKMQAWITKHNTAHGILQRLFPRSVDNEGHFCATRAQAAPVAQTRFPPSTPESLYARKQRVSCDFYPPNISSTKRQSSHANAKCNPGSPNNMAQRIGLAKITSA
jgi:hypothetical protein